MTKQGVRDLDHLTPKKKPAPTEPKGGSSDEPDIAPPAAVVPKGAVEPPIEK